MKKEHVNAYHCRQALIDCMTTCRTCRDVCIECRAGCSTKNALKCHNCIEHAFAKMQSCIEQAHRTIKEIDKHFSECGNQVCNDRMVAAVHACKAVIAATKKCQDVCALDAQSKPCMDAWRLTIKACDECIHACELLIAGDTEK